MRNLSWLALTLGVMLLALGACGGSGGGGGSPAIQPAPNLTGWWLEEIDDLEHPDGYLPYLIYFLEDDGTTVLYKGVALRKEGWTVRGARPDETDPDRQEVSLGIVNVNGLKGVMREYAADVVVGGELRRLTRTEAPDGRLVVNGTGALSTTAIDVSTAYAVEYDIPGGMTLLGLLDGSHDHGLTISFSVARPMPPGAYEVGAAIGDVSFQWFEDGRLVNGAGGSVVLTVSTATRIEGWYVVDLEPGTRLTGSFSADVRISGPLP